MLMRSLVGCAFLIWATSLASSLTIQRQTVQTGVQLPIWIMLPDNVKGKVPAIVLIHGSGGLKLDHKKFYAERFAKKGIATIAIDTFTPRGVSNTVENQSSVAPVDMGKDALGVLRFLKDHPHIDIDRVGVMGFSKGALVVMNLVLKTFTPKEGPLFDLYVAMYPPCNAARLNPKTNGRPLLVLLGESDSYNNPELCKEQISILKNNGSENVEAIVVPRAQHAWDVPGAAHKTVKGENYNGCKMVEVSPQIWIESKSGLTVFDHGRTKDRSKALQGCLTHQVSWGYSAEATRLSLEKIERFVSQLTRPRP